MCSTPPTAAQRAPIGRWRAPQLPAGLVLIAVAWPVAWAGPAPYSEYTFFPLWLGYILTVDGVTALRSGTSLLGRGWPRFAWLFVFSIPVWWLFEFANRYLHNWRYVTPHPYDPLAYALLASLDFSTVMPAIFVTAECVRTFAPASRMPRWIRIAPSRAGLMTIGAVGLLMFIASLAFPQVAFPLVWIGLFLFFDTINALTGARSIAAQVAVGRWDTVLVLFAAGLICGFFWEMWNYWSLPKWVYAVPYVGGLKVFEMPVLGYGGYLPFALEIYAAYHFLHQLIFRQPDPYLHFDDGDSRNELVVPSQVE